MIFLFLTSGAILRIWTVSSSFRLSGINLVLAWVEWGSVFPSWLSLIPCVSSLLPSGIIPKIGGLSKQKFTVRIRLNQNIFLLILVCWFSWIFTALSLVFLRKISDWTMFLILTSTAVHGERTIIPPFSLSSIVLALAWIEGSPSLPASLRLLPLVEGVLPSGIIPKISGLSEQKFTVSFWFNQRFIFIFVEVLLRKLSVIIELWMISFSEVLAWVERGSGLPASLCLLPLIHGVLPRGVVPNVRLVCLCQFDFFLVLQEKTDA